MARGCDLGLRHWFFGRERNLATWQRDRPVRDYWEQFASQRETSSGIGLDMPPAEMSPRDIADMDEALNWLLWVEDLRARSIILARGGGAPWTAILARLGISRAHGDRLRLKGLRTIADRLNEKRVPYTKLLGDK